MQIPLQEHWSRELLSELQRAVPVLESSSFNLVGDVDDADADDGSVGTAGGRGQWQVGRDGASSATPEAEGVRPSRGGLRLSDWAGDAGGAIVAREPCSEAPTDLLSEDAMALPMSTLTSGKRKTFSNKSTLQAHVSCVMDPLQVPRVLETLKVGSQFGTVRSWSYAYRIISPFDGQLREGSCDDDDPGVGEKMLGLLQRMGLENLLLIMSRWDAGAPERLGAELFRCVNEQCKELLRELQQAVRASFPLEELVTAHSTSGDLSSSHQRSQDTLSEDYSESCSTARCGVIDLSALGPLQEEVLVRAAVPGMTRRRRALSPPLALQATATEPPPVPPELAVRQCGLEERPLPGAAPLPAAEPSPRRQRRQPPLPANEPSPRRHAPAAAPVSARSEPRRRSVPISRSVPTGRTVAEEPITHPAVEAPVTRSAAAVPSAVHVSVEEALACERATGLAELTSAVSSSSTLLSAAGATGPGGQKLSSMSNEQLMRLAEQLREERRRVETVLEQLADPGSVLSAHVVGGGPPSKLPGPSLTSSRPRLAEEAHQGTRLPPLASAR